MAVEKISHEEFFHFLGSYSNIFDIDVDLISQSSKYTSYIAAEVVCNPSPRSNTTTDTNTTDEDDPTPIVVARKMPEEESSYLMPYADIKGDKLIIPPAPIEYRGATRPRSRSVCHINKVSSSLLHMGNESGKRRRSECFFDQKQIILAPPIRGLSQILDNEPRD